MTSRFRLGLSLAALLFGAGLFSLLMLDSPPRLSRGGLFEISSGAGAGVIAGNLQRRGHIRSAIWFRALSRLLRSDAKLKAGVYRLEAGSRASEILFTLLAARTAAIRVTIPEGWASWQIAARLEALGIVAAADFLPLARREEGFLFPETYYFEPHATAGTVRDAMTDRFWQELAAVVKNPDLPRDPAHLLAPRWRVKDVVTLASLIERETHLAEEQGLVSAVYQNRLRKRMRLECDPTVQYALGRWKSPLYKRDLLIASPYNTYQHFGLPPGPIASPGRGALAAALEPPAVDYLYFVADASGGHRFSRTYKEHQEAVAQRRKMLKQLRKPIK